MINIPKMETISDIVAEMRANTAKSKDEAWYDREKWSELCNRIEAAIKREREAFGNAAKTREALYAINRIDTRGLKRLLYVLIDADIFDSGLINKTISSVDKAKAVLSDPPRNCDSVHELQ